MVMLQTSDLAENRLFVPFNSLNQAQITIPSLLLQNEPHCFCENTSLVKTEGRIWGNSVRQLSFSFATCLKQPCFMTSTKEAHVTAGICSQKELEKWWTEFHELLGNVDNGPRYRWLNVGVPDFRGAFTYLVYPECKEYEMSGFKPLWWCTTFNQVDSIYSEYFATKIKPTAVKMDHCAH